MANFLCPETISPKSLQEVIDRVEAMVGAPEKKKLHVVSSVRRIARMLDLPPADISADIRELRKRVSTIHPAQAGITAKSFQNIKSDLLAALQLASGQEFSEISAGVISPEWAALLQGAEPLWRVYNLARLAGSAPPLDTSPSRYAMRC